MHQTYRVVLNLHLQLGVLLADDGELDPDVAALSPAQQTLLENKIFRFDSFERKPLTSLMRGKVEPSAPLLLITTIDP